MRDDHGNTLLHLCVVHCLRDMYNFVTQRCVAVVEQELLQIYFKCKFVDVNVDKSGDESDCSLYARSGRNSNSHSPDVSRRKSDDESNKAVLRLNISIRDYVDEASFNIPFINGYRDSEECPFQKSIIETNTSSNLSSKSLNQRHKSSKERLNKYSKAWANTEAYKVLGRRLFLVVSYPLNLGGLW